MAQVQVELSETELQAIHQYAAQHDVPVSELLKDYVDFLLAGGQPIGLAGGDLPASPDLAPLAQSGRAFDWLAVEPEIYSAADGEPV